jgi:hypothetical protein
MRSGTEDASAQRHPLAAVRAARGWSYQDLVEAVAAQSRSLGVPMAARREKAWRWENWGVVPDADSQRALAMALGVPPARMGVRPWPGWLPTGAELPVELAWNPEGSLTALRELLADIEEDRRAFAVAGPAVLADALTAWSVPVPPAPAASQHPDNAEDDVSAWLRVYTLSLPPLFRATSGTDPQVLRRRLDADLRLIAELLSVARVRRGLYQTTAKIALVAARRSIRDGLHGPAQRYLFTALRCARSAGDGCLGATILAATGRHLAGVGDEAAGQRFRKLAEDVRAWDGEDVEKSTTQGPAAPGPAVVARTGGIPRPRGSSEPRNLATGV